MSKSSCDSLMKIHLTFKFLYTDDEPPQNEAKRQRNLQSSGEKRDTRSNGYKPANSRLQEEIPLVSATRAEGETSNKRTNSADKRKGGKKVEDRKF